MILLVITMFFSGGLVPYYLLVLSLGLVDTIWALVLPNAIVAWNVIIFRTFFRTVPGALRESAHIDRSWTLTFRGCPICSGSATAGVVVGRSTVHKPS